MKNCRSKPAALSWVVLILTTLSGLQVQASELPYYNDGDFTPMWLAPEQVASSDFHRIPPFALTNQNGELIDQSTVDGRLYVVSFFFTTCPGICPVLRSKLALVQDAYLHDPDVLILSHSIRPSTDTPELLRAYAQRNKVVSGKWHLLTGEREAIYHLARTGYFANEDQGEVQDENDFLHSEQLILIDQQGYIRGVYNGLSTRQVGNLIEDVELLQQEWLWR